MALPLAAAVTERKLSARVGSCMSGNGPEKLRELRNFGWRWSQTQMTFVHLCLVLLHAVPSMRGAAPRQGDRMQGRPLKSLTKP